jgi:conjugal transfer ATP-binding protein TraC
MGADERIGDILTSIISDVLVAGCEFQIINYASPRIAEKLQEWALPRIRAGAVFNKLARYRLDLLRGGAWTSLATDGPSICASSACCLPWALARVRASIPRPCSPCATGSPRRSTRSMSKRGSSARPSSSASSTMSSALPPARAMMRPITALRSDQRAVHSPRSRHPRREGPLILEAPSLRPSGLVIDGTPRWPR